MVEDSPAMLGGSEFQQHAHVWQEHRVSTAARLSLMDVDNVPFQQLTDITTQLANSRAWDSSRACNPTDHLRPICVGLAEQGFLVQHEGRFSISNKGREKLMQVDRLDSSFKLCEIRQAIQLPQHTTYELALALQHQGFEWKAMPGPKSKLRQSEFSFALVAPERLCTEDLV